MNDEQLIKLIAEILEIDVQNVTMESSLDELECAEAGATLVLVARDEERLSKVAANLPGSGHIIRVFDFETEGDVSEMVRSASAEVEGLDGLVHAAGLHSSHPLRSLNPAEMLRLYQVNVVVAAMLVKGLRHKAVRKPGASVVLLSSAVGLVGQAGLTSYSSSKGALVTLTKTLALELAREDIRVNCLCPGVVETPMTEGLRNQIGDVAFARVEQSHPLGLGSVEDIALAARFLLSGASRWITGAAIPIDGGFTAQ